MDQISALIYDVANYKYKDKRLQKQAFILRRSKNERIKAKALDKLFHVYIEESKTTLNVKVVGEGTHYVYCDILDSWKRDESNGD